MSFFISIKALRWLSAEGYKGERKRVIFEIGVPDRCRELFGC